MARLCRVATDCPSAPLRGRHLHLVLRHASRTPTRSDVDCGGTLCGKCGDGKRCTAATDCVGNRCTVGICTSCTDARMNGDESDIDCGGTMCTACANGRRCNATTDCVSRICATNACVAANCTDTTINGTESDIDCGGADCAQLRRWAASAGRGPTATTGVCGAGTLCAAATCSDGVQNQGETDVDCGGATTCARCADFKTCTAADRLRDQHLHDGLLRHGRLPFVRHRGRLRRLRAHRAGRDVALRGHPHDRDAHRPSATTATRP